MKEPHLVNKPHSAPHTKSIESHVIVAGTANLKMCVYEFPISKVLIYEIHQDRSLARNRPKCNPFFVSLRRKLRLM